MGHTMGFIAMWQQQDKGQETERAISSKLKLQMEFRISLDMQFRILL